MKNKKLNIFRNIGCGDVKEQKKSIMFSIKDSSCTPVHNLSKYSRIKLHQVHYGI